MNWNFCVCGENGILRHKDRGNRYRKVKMRWTKATKRGELF